jgi:hypothetical protein
MQQLSENTGAKPYPNFNPKMRKGDSEGIEREAINLQASLGSGNLSVTRSTLRQLRMLAGMVGGLGKRSAQVQGTINSAIAKAQSKISQLEMEENNPVVTQGQQAKFQTAIYSLLSTRAKRFFDDIDEDASFTIAPVMEDGELAHHAKKKVDGKTLKRLITLIKFHSLDTTNKKKVLYEAFGSEAAEEEGTPKDVVLLAKKKKELLNLHEALDTMEAYKAYVISMKYKPDVAAVMIEKNHQKVMLAHEQIDEVAHQYDDLISDVNNGMAMAKVKVAKLKMKRMLKEDIIDHMLLDQETNAPVISGGLTSSQTTPHFPLFATTQLPSAQPFAN